MSAAPIVAGPLTRLLDALELLAHELEAPLGLNVYRWWEPGMRLPALWHWLEPSSAERQPTCAIRDTLRITTSLAALPAAHTGEDMLGVEELADAYVALIDPTLETVRNFGGTHSARRLGLRLAEARLGETTAIALEVPLELAIDRPIPI